MKSDSRQVSIGHMVFEAAIAAILCGVVLHVLHPEPERFQFRLTATSFVLLVSFCGLALARRAGRSRRPFPVGMLFCARIISGGITIGLVVLLLALRHGRMPTYSADAVWAVIFCHASLALLLIGWLVSASLVRIKFTNRPKILARVGLGLLVLLWMSEGMQRSRFERDRRILQRSKDMKVIAEIAGSRFSYLQHRLDAINRLRGSQYIGLMCELADSRDEDISFAAIKSLSSMDNKQANQKMLELMSKGNGNAAGALQIFHFSNRGAGPDALPTVIKAMRDHRNDMSFGRVCANSLSKCKVRNAVRLMVELLPQENASTQKIFVHTIMKLTGERFGPDPGSKSVTPAELQATIEAIQDWWTEHGEGFEASLPW